MARPIATRIHRTVFASCLISLAATVAVFFVGYEQLEHSILDLDFTSDRNFLLQQTGADSPQSWKTANLTAFYVPDGSEEMRPSSELFRGLPFPFAGEIEAAGSTYMVSLANVDGGRLYLAKDISLFEQREAVLQKLLAVVCLIALAISFVLAIVSARRLARPLQSLAAHIRATLPGKQMPRLTAEFKDEELDTIAASFNGFLGDLEAYVQRERQLLAAASHELRTPIAVISGAVDILDNRGGLSAQDSHTLDRVRQAATEMADNTDMLLALARRRDTDESAETIDLPGLARAVRDDIDRAAGGSERVQIQVLDNPLIAADPAWVQMLLRNLIQNALQHTTGPVDVRIQSDAIVIADRGGGLTEESQRLLEGAAEPSNESAPLSGLGLYIVTLICERLGWRVEADSCPRGTAVRVHYESNDHATDVAS